MHVYEFSCACIRFFNVSYDISLILKVLHVYVYVIFNSSTNFQSIPLDHAGVKYYTNTMSTKSNITSWHCHKHVLASWVNSGDQCTFGMWS